ncbi:MAG: hypothetical protein LBP85_08725 [Prevotellaceae bacterium]|jgi:hypothetical protein|nr:hypothetical protein [Prevotellaceae bacterium]
MKKMIFIVYFIAFVTIIYGQQTKQNTFQQPKVTIKEIDRLYKKYKDMESVTIYSTFGEIKGNISIELNSDNKPESITISGNTQNTDAIAEIVYDLIQQKVKEGYKFYSGTDINQFSWESSKDVLGRIKSHIDDDLKESMSDLFTTTVIGHNLGSTDFEATYKKGNNYFNVYISKREIGINKESSKDKIERIMNNPNSFSFPKESKYIIPHYFTIENGDNSRKGGKNATKFDF